MVVGFKPSDVGNADAVGARLKPDSIHIDMDVAFILTHAAQGNAAASADREAGCVGGEREMKILCGR